MDAKRVKAATHEGTATAAEEEIRDRDQVASPHPDPDVRTESGSSDIARVIATAAATSADAGTRAIEEIEKLIADLRTARSCLQTEGDRLYRELSRYESLSHTARTSAKVIVQGMGDWRKSHRLPNRPAV